MQNKLNTFSVAIIGGGPAGLMAAETLGQSGVHIDLYDAMPSVGRKFLMAGKGGMNITHAAPIEQFLSCYGARSSQIKPLLDIFSPAAVREWVHDLGMKTFVGTSGRVFPSDMKAAPLLRAWLQRLRRTGVNFHMRHKWNGWNENGELLFTTPQGVHTTNADAVILALGGGSWAQLGSDGTWVSILEKCNIPVEPLRPSNCGFDVGWSEHFKSRFTGHPIKSVTVTFVNAAGDFQQQQGDLMVTTTGVEGSPIYALSPHLRDEIAATGTAIIYLDLMPGKDLACIVSEISYPRGSRSMASHLQSRAKIKGVKAGLLRELVPSSGFSNPMQLAAAIKSAPLQLIAPRPLQEAISSAGGVAFKALNECLMVRAMPGVFCAGEMLDWEASTGGYLLTACFASGRAAGLGALAYLKCQDTQP